MDKSPDAYRTISEVAVTMDLPQHVLRFWETRFPQIKPLKRGGGRRYYRPEDVELLRAIKRLLYGHGYTIKGVQKMLRDQGIQSVVRSSPHAVATAPAEAPALAPVAPKEARVEPPMGEPVAPPRAPKPKPGLGKGEAAMLRALLAELREAERLLAQARAH
jgi:DNA-binding transcriptional MerR regulator